MFNGIISTSMRFFDTNPSGRILNRFSKDMGATDEFLPVCRIFNLWNGSLHSPLTIFFIVFTESNTRCISDYFEHVWSDYCNGRCESTIFGTSCIFGLYFHLCSKSLFENGEEHQTFGRNK